MFLDNAKEVHVVDLISKSHAPSAKTWQHTHIGKRKVIALHVFVWMKVLFSSKQPMAVDYLLSFVFIYEPHIIVRFFTNISQNNNSRNSYQSFFNALTDRSLTYIFSRTLFFLFSSISVVTKEVLYVIDLNNLNNGQ